MAKFSSKKKVQKEPKYAASTVLLPPVLRAAIEVIAVDRGISLSAVIVNVLSSSLSLPSMKEYLGELASKQMLNRTTEPSARVVLRSLGLLAPGTGQVLPTPASPVVASAAAIATAEPAPVMKVEPASVPIVMLKDLDTLAPVGELLPVQRLIPAGAPGSEVKPMPTSISTDKVSQ